MPVWQEILLVLGFWTILIGLLWLPLYMLLTKIDRKIKDGPRCRKCEYDLRAIENDQCPECGAFLKPRGVWPVGKPSRKPLIHLLLLWSWFVIAGSLTLIVLFSSNYYEIARHYEVGNDLFYLAQPKSQKYKKVSFSLASDAWQWFPGEEVQPLRIEQAAIWVETESAVVAMCTFNPDTGEFQMPMHEWTRSEMTIINGSLPDEKTTSVTEFIVNELNKYPDTGGDSQHIHEEIEQALQLALQMISTQSTLPLVNPSEREIDQAILLIGSPILFEHAVTSEWGYYEVGFLSAWTYAVTPISGALIWLLGVFYLRRRIYERMAVDGIPQSERLNQST